MKNATIYESLHTYLDAFCFYVNKRFAFDPDMNDEVLWCECSHIWDQLHDMLWLCRHYHIKSELDWEFYEMIYPVIRLLREGIPTIDDLVSIKVLNRTLDLRLFDRSLFVQVAQEMEKKETWEDWYGDRGLGDYLVQRSMTKVAPGEYLFDVKNVSDKMKNISKKKKFPASSLDFN